MEKIKPNINTILGIAILILTVVNSIIYKLDYTYIPNNYILFTSIHVLIAICAIIFSVKYKKVASKTSKIFGYIMPIIALVYILVLLLILDTGIINNQENNTLYNQILFTTTIVSSLIIFFNYNKFMWLRICSSIVTAIFTIGYSLIVLISIVLPDINETTIVQTLNSPENTYSAYIISDDQGALGGSTHVYIRNIKKNINFLTGTLRKEEQRIWRGSWNANPTLEWKDDHNILINNKNYDVKKL